ncbi:MAG: glycosyltransferase family 2 protein [Chloroflexi bacterium]|nr:glycosyltransferase family 2 protein [Chloroflexota bacterium]
MLSLSYVVPAYNEEERLGDSLAKLIAYSADQPYAVEIIVVDDGSADRTAEIATAAIADLPDGVTANVIKHNVNQGKGAAVRTGALAASSDVVLYLDADLSTQPDQTSKLLAALAAGADVAIGSRIRPEGGDMRASQPAWRRVAGRLFALLRRRLLLSDIEDTQCGFKAFSRPAAQAIFSRQQLNGWAFDAELLYLAHRLGYSVVQVPIEWHHVEGSRFKLGAGSAYREVRDLVRVRWLHRGLTSGD